MSFWAGFEKVAAHHVARKAAAKLFTDDGKALAFLNRGGPITSAAGKTHYQLFESYGRLAEKHNREGLRNSPKIRQAWEEMRKARVRLSKGDQ